MTRVDINPFMSALLLPEYLIFFFYPDQIRFHLVALARLIFLQGVYLIRYNASANSQKNIFRFKKFRKK